MTVFVLSQSEFHHALAIEQKVTAVNHRKIAIQADTPSLHVDEHFALTYVRNIDLVFKEKGIEFRSLSKR